MKKFTQQPTPAPAQVELPSEFPPIPQEIIDRFGPSALEWNRKLRDFWTKSNQAIQQAQEQTSQQVNSSVIYNVDQFLIYTSDGAPQPMFSVDSTGVKLGDVVVINTPSRKMYIGAGNYADDDTPFYVDADGKVSFGASLTWDPDTDTLDITGTINADSGTIGGFDIGADYIRDVADSFGLASTVTVSPDVRFWAGNTFANRNIAPLRIYEDGLIRVEALAIDGVGSDQAISFQKNTVMRWFLSAQGAESGGNSGSNISFFRYDDSGNYLSEAFSIIRSTGAFYMNGNADIYKTNIGVTSTDGLALHNEQPAAAGAQQWSPRLRFIGTGWRTDATAQSQFVEWIIENKTIQGTANASGELVFSYQVASGGYSPIMSLTSTGINAVNIGATTPGSGAFTTIGASGDFTYSSGAAERYIQTTNGQNFLGLNQASGYVRIAAGNTQSAIFRATGVEIQAALQVGSLAGVGTRTVVADASGNLSAP